MDYRFQHHYTRDEARALLPEVRVWLDQIRLLRDQLGEIEPRLEQLLSAGNDVGGEEVTQWLRAVLRIQEQLRKFQKREILIKDLDRGLVDFPAIIGEREVFLCWEQDETDIDFWHDLDSGYAGRERI